MTLDSAVAWTSRLLALAAALAALELLCVRRALADDGVFRWSTLRRELAGAPRPVRALADALFCYRGTLAILTLQLAGALALPWIAHPAPAWLVFACVLLIAIRFRGSYNGGSDSMLLVVALALALARSAPRSRLALGGLAWAAVQLVLSYFVSGIAKLGDPLWRSGRALPILVALPHYRVPAWAVALLSRPAVARVAGWSMLAFECLFPVAFADARVGVALLAFGAAFHVVNAVVFGLNRFLWAWLAAYPALLFWATQPKT